MKIHEVLSEAGEFDKGRAFGKRLVSPSQWIKPEAGGTYEKGKAFGKKLVSPSQWFKGSNSSSPDEEPEPEKKLKPKSTSVQAPSVDMDKVKQITTNVLRGEPQYKEDLAVLARFRAGLDNGSIQVNVDSTELSKTVKAIETNTALTAAQTKLLQDFSS
jgi:hypothetical protein